MAGLVRLLKTTPRKFRPKVLLNFLKYVSKFNTSRLVPYPVHFDIAYCEHRRQLATSNLWSKSSTRAIA